MVINARSATTLNLLAQFSDYPGRVIAISGDVSEGVIARRVVAEAIEELGSVDILVNNAGITNDKLLLKMTEDDFEGVLKVNLTGAFNMTQAVLKPMIKARQGAIINMSSVVGLTGNVAMWFGANGICKSVNTACASANDAIGEAFRTIKFGYQDVMLVGGSESAITKFAMAGFQALTALSTTADQTRASIPFDKDRNCFVMGEGAAILVLESLEHAEKRGASILAEVVGYGHTCDAHHMTSQHPEGLGAIKAMKLALSEAGIEPSQVGYINAHGTSTPVNEKGESAAIVQVFGKTVPVSSTKSFTGHLLGAAGAVEAIEAIEVMRHSFIPMTAGTKELSDYIEADVVYGQGRPAEVAYAVSNTFGFGGHNAVLAFKRWED